MEHPSKREVHKRALEMQKLVPSLIEGGMVVGTTKYVAGKGASPILTKLGTL